MSTKSCSGLYTDSHDLYLNDKFLALHSIQLPLPLPIEGDIFSQFVRHLLERIIINLVLT